MRKWHDDIRLLSANADYDDDELEFMLAVQKFKEITGIRFPKWSEVLAVLKSLGYRKTTEKKP